MRFDARLVFDLVAHDVERAVEGIVQIHDLPDFVGASAREILEVLHDVLDAHDAVARLGEQRDDVTAQEIEIDALAQRPCAAERSLLRG